MKKPSVISVSRTALLAVAFLLTGLVSPVSGADHRDAPRINEDPRADILDTYVFTNPNNTNKIVLATTVNPLAIGGAAAVAFSAHALYQFKIDNTGDLIEDLVIQGTFSESLGATNSQGGNRPQEVTVIGPARIRGKSLTSTVLDARKAPRFSGLANGTTFANTAGTMRAFAGLCDDPFFFDLIYVLRLLGLQPGGPLARQPGIDFFAGLNCSAWVVEVDAALLQGPTVSKEISIWATVSRPSVSSPSTRVGRDDRNSTRYVQVEREGKPALSTVLIKGKRKDDFNRGIPSTDRLNFGEEALEVLISLNGDPAYSRVAMEALLPDVLTINMGSLDGYDFPMAALPPLNGRRLQDDVIDTTLRVGSRGAVTSDGVNQNDVPFRPDFPFVAPPHSASVPVPPRN